MNNCPFPPASPKPSNAVIHGMDAEIYWSWRRFHLNKAKLNNVAEMASLMAGFAIVATVELQINEDSRKYPNILIAFAVVTSLLVATSMLTVMISTCILPEFETINKMSSYSKEEISRSPHDALTKFVNLSWVLANTVSIFLFTLDVIIMAWIKFACFSKDAAIAATCIMGPVLLVILAFGLLFYRAIAKHQYDVYLTRYEHAAMMKRNLEEPEFSGQYDVQSLTSLQIDHAQVNSDAVPAPVSSENLNPALPPGIKFDAVTVIHV